MSRLVVVLLLAGCATAPAPKMSFDEATRPAPSTPRAKRFEASLARFTSEVAKARKETPAGARMPERMVQAWSTLLDDAERLEKVNDAIRARLQLEAELQADARQFGDIPAEVAARMPQVIASLSQRIAARTPKVRQVDPRGFRWPVSPLVVSSPYGRRVHPIAGELRFHAGIDLEAPLETPVLAAESGTVVFSDWNGGHGNQIELQHDPHWSTRYSHLEQLLVKPGASVKKGQVIGLAGATGMATGPHVHFELRRDGDALDPEAFLRTPSFLLSVAP
ncbi:MAG TPA: M23 family metallopeptidase [Archangium sp.]